MFFSYFCWEYISIFGFLSPSYNRWFPVENKIFYIAGFTVSVFLMPYVSIKIILARKTRWHTNTIN